MLKDLLEQLTVARSGAQIASPDQQKYRSEFYHLVWNNWDQIAVALAAQVALEEAPNP